MSEKSCCPLCGHTLDDIETDVIVFNGSRAAISVGGKSAVLTPHETLIFSALYRRRPNVFSKWALFDTLYGHKPECDQPADAKLIDVFICRMRRKLSPLGFEIKVHWGEGYSLFSNPPTQVKKLSVIDENPEAINGA